MRTQNGGGDQLARGMARVQFRSPEGIRTDEEYRAMFAGSDEVKKGTYVLICPVHGTFETDKEFFFSGGYPQGPDVYKTGHCKEPDCDETALYYGFTTIGASDGQTSGGDANMPSTGVSGVEPSETQSEPITR